MELAVGNEVILTSEQPVGDCPVCGREWYPWPIVRPAKCSPRDWAHCIRPEDPQTRRSPEQRLGGSPS